MLLNFNILKAPSRSGTSNFFVCSFYNDNNASDSDLFCLLFLVPSTHSADDVP